MFKGLLELPKERISTSPVSAEEVQFLLTKLNDVQFAVDNQSAYLFLLDNEIPGAYPTDLIETVMDYKKEMENWFLKGKFDLIKNIADLVFKKLPSAPIGTTLRDMVGLVNTEQVIEKSLLMKLLEIKLQATEEEEGWTRNYSLKTHLTKLDIEELKGFVYTNIHLSSRNHAAALHVIEAIAVTVLPATFIERHGVMSPNGITLSKICNKMNDGICLMTTPLEKLSSTVNVTSAHIIACKNYSDLAKMLMVPDQNYDHDAIRLFELKFNLENIND